MLQSGDNLGMGGLTIEALLFQESKTTESLGKDWRLLGALLESDFVKAYRRGVFFISMASALKEDRPYMRHLVTLREENGWMTQSKETRLSVHFHFLFELTRDEAVHNSISNNCYNWPQFFYTVPYIPT